MSIETQPKRSFDSCSNTVARGEKEIEERLETGGKASNRAREKGGGRKRIEKNDTRVLSTLKELAEGATRGDPMSPLCRTNKSTYKIADEMNKRGHKTGPRTVSKLLQEDGYGLQRNRKTKEGTEHPDRNGQFEYINGRAIRFMKSNRPVISTDAKKKEIAGNFTSKGEEWRPKKDPEKASARDFIDKEPGKAIPFGVYDVKMNEGGETKFRR
jgi:hypothetical protein